MLSQSDMSDWVSFMKAGASTFQDILNWCIQEVSERLCSSSCLMSRELIMEFSNSAWPAKWKKWQAKQNAQDMTVNGGVSDDISDQTEQKITHCFKLRSLTLGKWHDLDKFNAEKWKTDPQLPLNYDI
jgi:hypothetical protein